jgi:hypothetical protein
MSIPLRFPKKEETQGYSERFAFVAQVDVTGPAQCRKAQAERRDGKAGRPELARRHVHGRSRSSMKFSPTAVFSVSTSSRPAYSLS